MIIFLGLRDCRKGFRGCTSC